MDTRRSLTAFCLAGAIAVPMFIGQPRHAEAAFCPPIPNVDWWSKDTKKIIAYVHQRHEGNWNAYTRKWIAYHDKMAQHFKLGKAVVMKSRGITLRGEDLAKYVRDIDKRITVVRCLAKSTAAAEIKAAVAEATDYNCRPVPNVVWWGDLNHDGLITLVKARHKGNWKPFIADWESEMKVLLTSFNLGQEAIVSKTGLALSQEELALYYTKVLELVSVMHCLADDAERAKAKKKG